MSKEVKIIQMSDVQTEDVRWLWYPYIPYGKITIIQGDPGDGKTTFVLALSALLTKGQSIPNTNDCSEPITVIYQTAEDGLADTIKPRLEKAGADCTRVCVIDESEQGLSFADERLESAVKQLGAKLLILDPLQAYLGSHVDMFRPNEVRPLFKGLTGVAERTGCAIVIIGHMNKMSGAKALYRGLGSIDIPAAARSILLIGKSKENPDKRVMAHLKSSLAPTGQSIIFELGECFKWRGTSNISAEELASGSGCQPTKKAQATELLTELLSAGEKPCTEIYEYFNELGIGRRTVDNAKKELGIQSKRKGDAWYWIL